MKDKKTIKEELGAEPVIAEMSPELTAALEKLGDKLDKLDISIDYLTAAITGEDPLSISIGQSVGGRLMRSTHQPKMPELGEAKKVGPEVSESSLMEMIRAEILKIVNEGK